MTNQQIEEKVTELQEKFKINKVPVPLELIAENLNINIKKAPSKEYSGLLLRKEGKAFIGVNNTESHVRQRFTIAHELGHYHLHMDNDAFVDYLGYRDNKKNIVRTNKERQANFFASCLLMPKFLLMKDIEILLREGGNFDNEIEELSRKYDVSKETMTYRILNLGFSLGN